MKIAKPVINRIKKAELEAYNPMIPSGRNFKATFMIEYTDPEIRAI